MTIAYSENLSPSRKKSIGWWKKLQEEEEESPIDKSVYNIKDEKV